MPPNRTRAPKSIESFGPEIFEALIEGSKREIVLELPYKKAVAFRQRANALRAAMREAGHEKAKIVAQTTLKIVWGKEAGFEETLEKRNTQNVRFPISKTTPAKLIICPADAEFGDALRKAGVELRPLSAKPETSDPSTPPEDDFGDDILNQFLKGELNASDK